jgi:sulfur-carrier protein adenylyltransferase/sulfurtransferase
VAAQILSGQGFGKVYNLKGGIKAWQGLTAAGPAESGMALLTGKETTVQVIFMALGLEEGLRAFYEDMAQKAASAAISELFGRLAAIEVKHKAKLLELHAVHSGSEPGMGPIDSQVMVDMMEGGLTAEEFLKLNQPAMQTNQEVVAMAMTIEAQALDLYMRQARRLDDDASRKILERLADDEKAHLAALGKLMDALSIG